MGFWTSSVTGYFHAQRCHSNKETKSKWKSVSVCPDGSFCIFKTTQGFAQIGHK